MNKFSFLTEQCEFLSFFFFLLCECLKFAGELNGCAEADSVKMLTFIAKSVLFFFFFSENQSLSEKAINKNYDMQWLTFLILQIFNEEKNVFYLEILMRQLHVFVVKRQTHEYIIMYALIHVWKGFN